MPRSKFQTVENYPPLKEWLTLHDARSVWSLSTICSTEAKPAVEAWRIGSAIIFVILHPDRPGGVPGGWDIATVPNTNNIRDTFEDVEARIGLEIAR